MHRATDAVLTAMDELAATHANLVFVVTSNFVTGLDTAFLSRADTVIEVGLPTTDALEQIIADVLRALGAEYEQLLALAEDPRLRTVAATVEGIDGRQARKLVMRALALRLETAIDAGQLTFEDLSTAAKQTADQLRRQVSRVHSA